MTIATTSPTKRTRSPASAGCGARKATCWRRMISSWGLPGIGLCVSGLDAIGRRRPPVSTAITPGVARGRGVSMRPIARSARGASGRNTVDLPGQVDVVAVAAAAHEQARVVLAEDRLADAIAGRSRQRP
jgi:hypothetical protein